MKQEMRKLNRAKYAHTAEEMAQLSAQGYVPVGTAVMDLPDTSSDQEDEKAAPPGSFSGVGNKKASPRKAASGAKNKKNEQPAAALDQEACSAEQPVEKTEKEVVMPSQSAVDPAQAVKDGGDSGT